MNERRNPIIPAQIIDEETTFTLVELCRCSGADSVFVERLVEEGVLEPQANPEDTADDPVVFPGVSLKRTRVSLHLTRDLGVNPAGVALAIELLERIQELQDRLRSIRSR
jgi:chaperone modulatory protein CbpM